MKTSMHKWNFANRFRRNAFGWRSQPAITHIKEAVSEIKKVARTDSVLGAEGAVLLLEKLSPALANIDSSSGAIGAAVNNAIYELVPVIAKAPADDKQRSLWLERLWEAIEEDDIPYLEYLIEFWGDLCATPETASRWADELIGTARMALNHDPAVHGYFKGTTACLSALLKAGRNKEILELLELKPSKWWHDRQWGVKALLAMGEKSEALQYAENSRGLNVSPVSIAKVCEEILLSSGMAEEAYNRYGIEANHKMTYLATFREIVKKYPHKNAKDILNDLVESAPGNEGKWFAAARSAGLYAEAIELANSTPCDPKTLTRAARDMAGKEPRFAVEAGMAAIKWLVEGYGYDITSLDIRDAYKYTMEAAQNGGYMTETLDRIRALVEKETYGERFVTKILGPELDINSTTKRIKH